MGRQPGETIHRSVEREESLDNGSEQVSAGADELFFVQFEINRDAAGEGDTVLRDESCEFPFVIKAGDAGDLFLQMREAGVFVEAQDFLESFAAILDQREMVHGKVGNQAPE